MGKKTQSKRRFGEVIEAAITRSGLSRVELADAAGVSKNTVYRALANEGKDLSVEHLEAICGALDINPRTIWRV